MLPHRLNDDWRKVVEQMDFLDVPGMRAVRTGIEQGKRTEANTLEEQMEIVKRGISDGATGKKALVEPDQQMEKINAFAQARSSRTSDATRPVRITRT